MREARPVPVLQDLVLVGGGHSHVTVLKRFGMKPVLGVRLTLVCRDVHTPYSGMLPGLIAGHYSYDDAHIDLEKLARFAQARFIRAEVTGLDPGEKRLRFESRPSLAYDVLSINTGSTPDIRVPGAAGRVVPVKPINLFLPYWEKLVARTLAAKGRRRIGIVGAGAGGVELTLAAQHRLRALGAEPEFHIFSAANTLLPTHNSRTQQKFVRVLGERGVNLHLACRIVEVTEAGVLSEDGEPYPLDEILWTTQAGAPEWPRAAGLAADERGFIQVGDTLESVSHPGVFAAGDVAAMVNHPREKAGVFAVRQGPPLETNLRRMLLGEALKPFRPQRQFLSIVSTGDKYAVASRSFWSFEGAWVWRWKDWIDRRFMEKFGELPGMAPPGPGETPAARGETGQAVLRAAAMRCAGCGSKVGAGALERALGRLPRRAGGAAVLGLDAPDDAAVIRIPEGMAAVQSVDFFPAIVDDPFVFGKIAANHALNDLFAMGATPCSALAVAVTPFAREDKVEEQLAQMLLGADEVLHAAGADLAGGHSSEGPELALGFAVTGYGLPDALWRKSGLQPGDKLILTKALGTGTLFAAAMRLRAKGRWIEAAIDSMTLPGAAAAEVLREHGVTACTDVTGFGLLGHLSEMLRASGVGAVLRLGRIPALAGAHETLGQGLVSSLHPDNKRLENIVEDGRQAASHPSYPLLFDPQTAGGLLAGVGAARAEACVEELQRRGCEDAAVIGEAVEGEVTVRLEP